MKKLIFFWFFTVLLSINNAFCMESYSNAMIVSLHNKPYIYNSIELLNNDAAVLKGLIKKEKEEGRYSRRLCAAGQTLGTLLDQQCFGINIEKMFGPEAVNLARSVVKKEAIKRELFDLVADFCYSQFSMPSYKVCSKFQQINQEFPDVLNAHYPEINGATLMHRLAIAGYDYTFCSIMDSCDAINPNVVDKEGNTLLHIALNHKAKGTIESLLKHKKIDLTVSNKCGEFPFDRAVSSLWAKKICKALQDKLIEELRSKDHACEKVVTLLYAGADVDLGKGTYEGDPLLCEFFEQKCKNCISLVTEKIDKDDINKALSFQSLFGNFYEQSLLRRAIIAKIPETVQLCLSATSACVREKYGSLESTPLLLAAISGCIDNVKILLEHGALVKREMLACPWIDNKQIIELLEHECKKQVCIICYNNQNELGCSLEYMPCAEHHPDTFLCAGCYGKIGNTKESCPICRRDLQVYPSVSKIYQLWR